MALEYLTWWLMSPGVACFLFLNVLVAAIVVTSRSRAQQGDGGRRAASTRRRLCRSASPMVLDRLRSFSAAMFSTHPSVELCYFVSPGAEEVKEAIPMSENTEDESAAGVVVKSTSSDGNALGQDGGAHAQELMPSPPAAAAPAVAVVTAETARVALLVRGPPKEEPAMVAAEFVKRKHRRRDHVYAVEAKAELNARAEQFIRQFRQELKLQRLNSLLSRHAHTLGTGSGVPAKPCEQRD